MSTEKSMEITKSHINSLAAIELAADPGVMQKFVELYNKIHGVKDGQMIAHKEVFNYRKLLAENPTLRECENLSLYGCFLDVAVNKLSLEGGKHPDCYLTPRSVNVGTRDNKQYVKRAVLNISPYGELKMRMNSGQIKYADNPIVVYEGDKFKVGLGESGKLVVKEYEAAVPRKKDAKIIACFIRIERYDGSYEMPYLDSEAIERLKGYSSRQNNGSPNALYTSNGGQIDTGFLKAKTIKHAFSAYPKVRTSDFSQLDPMDESTQHVDYGFDTAEGSGNTQDVDYHEEKDEFSNAVDQEEEPPVLHTVSVPADDDDDLFNNE